MIVFEIVLNLPNKHAANPVLNRVHHFVAQKVRAIEAPLTGGIDTLVNGDVAFLIIRRQNSINRFPIRLVGDGILIHRVPRQAEHDFAAVDPQRVDEIFQNVIRTPAEGGMVLHGAIVVIGHDINAVKLREGLLRKAGAAGLSGGNIATVGMKGIRQILD